MASAGKPGNSAKLKGGELIKVACMHRCIGGKNAFGGKEAGQEEGPSYKADLETACHPEAGFSASLLRNSTPKPANSPNSTEERTDHLRV
jgi:hypothetical protein